MFSALDMAITQRFLGFVNEVIGCRPISRTLRALVMRPAPPASNADNEVAVVFFAPGVKGVAIALWAANQPSAAPIPTSLLRALEGSSDNFLEVTTSEEIHGILTTLYSALEAELRGTPAVALMLAPAFAGAAFDLAATAIATAHMPPNGNLSLANYLATFPSEHKVAAYDVRINASNSDMSSIARPRQLL
jgi:hypothetical protein